MPVEGFTRRRFLGATIGGAAALAVGASSAGSAGAVGRRVLAATAAPSADPGPFTLGVASGDPLPDRVVLWTRLAPDPLNGGGMPPVDQTVDYEVATDAGFAGVVAAGTVTAPAAHAHSVHLDLGGLQPDTWYWYRFRHGGVDSPIGRTRTAPAGGATVAALTLGVVSCQDFVNGYYTAYHHLSSEDLDLVVHLGDYIYEGGGSRVRSHNSAEIITVDDYRNRYALYKGDADLQAAHQAFPWVVVWDDHEADNNYAGATPEVGAPAVDFLARRAAAYQAWWEHQPVRLSPPSGADLRIYRTFAWGGLADLFALDTRQYRSDQACGDNLQLSCGEDLDPSRSMMGFDQEAWLAAGLRGSSASWALIAQQVVFGRLEILGRFNMDQWDGYAPARQRLVDVLTDPTVPSAAVLSGDIHAAGQGDIRVDQNDPASRVVGSEWVTTSVTSSTFGDDGLPGLGDVLVQNTPGLHYANTDDHGYLRLTVTDEQLHGAFQVVDTITQPTAGLRTDREIVVPRDRSRPARPTPSTTGAPSGSGSGSAAGSSRTGRASGAVQAVSVTPRFTG